MSFVCLTSFVKKYGLKRFLFFDKLCNESEIVRKGYTAKLNRSLKIVSSFVIPCFLAETAYKVWWYASGASQIPFLGIVWLSDSVACFMELCSWLYRTTVFFLVCVLFHLVCNLQVLRLQDFAQVFQVDSDVGSQFTSLLVTLKATSELNIYKAGELLKLDPVNPNMSSTHPCLTIESQQLELAQPERKNDPV
ncbi:hypothetical protein GOBAR_AA06863 [Gossypium barbadense]|uniref:Uncharacterized protein n=1 Tax=Gossypium barbadense TaxID=3634 RepID=A0A2P5YDQ7_GOSBA|nr:hypothetical protein GOBAR_AA06863 [Gossypium barbadense]